MLARRLNGSGNLDPDGRFVSQKDYFQAVDVLKKVSELKSDDPEIKRLALIAKQEICDHKYNVTNIGRCLTRYNCPICGKSKEIDSGD